MRPFLRRRSPVNIEVLLLSESGGGLYYRRVAQPLARRAHPDDLARRISGAAVGVPGAILHSTSWRHERGVTVLTYAALPDVSPGDGRRPIRDDAVAFGEGPLSPSPARVDVDAVAAHACRHLALLATTDAEVALAAGAQPGLWKLLAKLAPGAPGGVRPVSLFA